MRLSKQWKSNIQLIGIVAFASLCYVLINYLFLGKIQLCMWRSLCGLPCPGCGLTHAGISLLTGKIRDSLHWHIFLIPIVFTLIITSIPSGWSRFSDRFREMKYFFSLLCILIFLYFIYRLITLFPQSPESGPMFYDPANYLRVIWNFLTGLPAWIREQMTALGW